MDKEKIEWAAGIAFDSKRLMTGREDLRRDVVNAIIAALEEYDKQKSEEEK